MAKTKKRQGRVSRPKPLKNSLLNKFKAIFKRKQTKKLERKVSQRISSKPKFKKSPGRTTRAKPASKNKKKKSPPKARATKPRSKKKEALSITRADNRKRAPVKKNKHREVESTVARSSRRTVTKKRYSQNLEKTIVFKKNTVNYTKGVRRGKINKFYREQAVGVDATNFYRSYGKSGKPQKFISRILLKVKIPGYGWKDHAISRSRFKAKSEAEFLRSLRDNFTGFNNPGAVISKYAAQFQWDDVKIIGVDFEVITNE